MGHATSDAASDPAGQDSALETAFSRRAGKTLRSSGTRSSPQPEQRHPPPFGTAQNDYLLGPGDEVRVTIRGGKYDSNRRYTVNSNGDVIVDQLRPLTAAGRTGRSAPADRDGSRSHHVGWHEAFVSLEGMRRMGILVTGAVRRRAVMRFRFRRHCSTR